MVVQGLVTEKAVATIKDCLRGFMETADEATDEAVDEATERSEDSEEDSCLILSNAETRV